jgi:hypothetical protein
LLSAKTIGNAGSINRYRELSMLADAAAEGLMKMGLWYEYHGAKDELIVAS